jgi:hypothetical protein
MTRWFVPASDMSRTTRVKQCQLILGSMLIQWENLSPGTLEGRFEAAHESGVEVAVDPPRLPCLASCGYIWTWRNVG